MTRREELERALRSAQQSHDDPATKAARIAAIERILKDLDRREVKA